MIAFLRPGFWEIAVVALVVVLLFGAKRLPDLARTVGHAAPLDPERGILTERADVG